MGVRKHIPNTITALNLLCGCIAIYLTLSGKDTKYIAAVIFIAAIFDFLDGMIARLLKAHSELGKQLDSLADMVSFGVVPGFIAFTLLSALTKNSDHIAQGYFLMEYIPFLAFIIPIFSAIRLAKFNLDIRQSEGFIGLPTPACTLFFTSILLYYSLGDSTQNFHQLLFSNWYILTSIIILFSYLLVAEIPMFSLKIKHLTWAENKVRIIYLVSCITLLYFIGLGALVLFIPLYISYSLLLNLFRK